MYRTISSDVLEYFVVIVREGGITRAAERLLIAQSTLSTCIHNLEEELQTPLLIRTRHGVEVTDAGKLFYREAVLAIQHADRARDLVLFRTRLRQDPFRVGYSPFIHAQLPPVLQELRFREEDAPKIVLNTRLTVELIDHVLSGETHAAFGILPITEPDLTVFEVVREPFLICIPDRHRLASTKSISSRDLDGEVLVWFARYGNPPCYDRTMRYFREARVRFREVHEVLSVVQAIELVAKGHGLALMGASNATLKRPGTVFRPLTDRLLGMETALFYRRDSKHPQMEHFINLAITQIGAAKLAA